MLTILLLRNHNSIYGQPTILTTIAAVSGILCFLFASPPIAHAQTFTVIYSFASGPDGNGPSAGLSMDRARNLYGTTQGGGIHNEGVVYRLTRHNSTWTATPLYAFGTSPNDGRNPWSRVIVGPDGALYGTTPYGGNSGCGGGGGCGIVYRLVPPAIPCPVASCQWPETIIHTFSGADGAYPGGGDLTFDRDGNIYGTTQGGGANSNGVVYKLTPSNGSWMESTLYNFTGGSDGGGPYAGVTFDGAGNLYGTTLGGGSQGNGTVYELKPSGSDWIQVTLHSFDNATEGVFSQAGLVPDTSGNFYGATSAQGPNGGGTVYELTSSNGSWSFHVLYALSEQFGQGGPAANMLWANGNVYGTMAGWIDGNDLGRVFELTPSNGSWSYVLLHEFSGNDGAAPYCSLIMDSAGNLYGTAFFGGSGGSGTVFEITP